MVIMKKFNFLFVFCLCIALMSCNKDAIQMSDVDATMMGEAEQPSDVDTTKIDYIGLDIADKNYFVGEGIKILSTGEVENNTGSIKKKLAFYPWAVVYPKTQTPMFYYAGPPVTTWEGPYNASYKGGYTLMQRDAKLLISDGYPWYPYQIYFCDVFKFSFTVPVPSGGNWVLFVDDIPSGSPTGYVNTTQTRGCSYGVRNTSNGSKELYIDFLTIQPKYNIMGQYITNPSKPILPNDGELVNMTYYIMKM
jgi:hypothetical protein